MSQQGDGMRKALGKSHASLALHAKQAYAQGNDLRGEQQLRQAIKNALRNRRENHV